MYSLKDIANIIDAEIINISDVDINNSINFQLLIDSRNLITPENTIFFSIVSKKNNGHKYIEELYRNNVRYFVISTIPENISSFTNAVFLKVTDTLKAIQKLTSAHRKKFIYPVIGITGSNGKTIIKEWLFQLLNPDKKIVRSPKSYNSQIGVPLSVWQMDDNYNLAIFEAGISEPDEMENIQNIMLPDIGIFTNIGNAHNENFINKNQKIGEKLKLFTKVKKLFYCSDYYDIKERILKSEILKNENIFSWSTKNDANLRIKQINKDKGHTLITGTLHNKENIEITIPFNDDASIENAIHCWAIMLYLGYENEIISRRMLNLAPVAMRLELKEGINNCSLIDDYYNLDINSLKIALEFLCTQNQHKNKTVILSDILQSGLNDDELYSEVASLLKEKGISRMIGIGPAISGQANKFNINKHFFYSTEEFLLSPLLNNLPNNPDSLKDSTILIKGARVYQFEAISSALQQKTHKTTLEINLSALINNLNKFRLLIKPQTKMAAMVKAFSYGAGSFEIANALQFHHIDYLAVAFTDEGIELRKAGINVPIIVMNAEEDSFDAMIKFNLEPEIYNLRILNKLEKAISRNLLNYENAVSIHLKIDTGMYRLGFEEKDIDELIGNLKNNRQIHIKSVFSHLAGSNDPTLDDFTNLQAEKFVRISEKIQSNFDNPIIRHLLNSSGIIRFPQYQFEMVRLGIGLYGVKDNIDKSKDISLQNVSSLKTIISQIKTVPAKETIGYSRSYLADKEMKIGIIPIGYADGLSRCLSNGNGKLLIHNKLAPIVGNISMDMCMVDLTGINAREGDEVIVFGDDYPIQNIANQLNTIPYEVLTSISGRVKRIYYQE